MKSFPSIFLLLLIGTFPAFGQSRKVASDTGREQLEMNVPQAKKETNTTAQQHHSFFISPKRTGLYSAILPGLGQAFNHQYWKIPIIYAGAAVAAYYIYDNRKNYDAFRSIYIGRMSNDPAAFLKHPELTSLSQVEDAMKYYRHYLDLTVALSVAGYALQIIDAVVFSNLKGFDISPNISLRVRPVLYPSGGMGFGLVMNF